MQTGMTLEQRALSEELGLPHGLLAFTAFAREQLPHLFASRRKRRANASPTRAATGDHPHPTAGGTP